MRSGRVFAQVRYERRRWNERICHAVKRERSGKSTRVARPRCRTRRRERSGGVKARKAFFGIFCLIPSYTCMDFPRRISVRGVDAKSIGGAEGVAIKKTSQSKQISQPRAWQSHQKWLHYSYRDLRNDEIAAGLRTGSAAMQSGARVGREL